MKEKWDFWVLVGLMIAIIFFILNMNINMATKADIARVENSFKTEIARVENSFKTEIAEVKDELRDIRNMIFDHIKDGHAHSRKSARSRSPANIGK